MKLLATAAVIGAAAALSAPQQVVMKVPEAEMPEPKLDSSSSAFDRLKNSLHEWTSEFKHLGEQFHSLAEEDLAAFYEVAMEFPEHFTKEHFVPKVKKHRKRPDSEWDHIVRGADIQSLWVENEKGHKEREIDGKLDSYSMRVKKVDPSDLGIDPGVKQYSGYLDDDEEDKHLFYWFFESRNDPKNDPVVLWLNGGPGCSSLTGLFMELGPSAINEKVETEWNPYSWNSNASVIFLDQPVNVGYSYSSGSVSNTVAAGKDIYALLTLFFKQFPEYASQDFHIAGESYAGHYIPVFTSEILSHKKRNINLKSVLIGNGLTDGYTQYEAYRPMACGDGGWPAVLGESECNSMDAALPRCQSLIERCYNTESAWTCVPASIYCNNALIGPYQRTGQNVYDVRGKCEDDSNLCYSVMGYVSEYLNKPEVMEAVGAEVSSYDSCNFDINRNFLFNGDWMKPYHRLVPDILQEIPVLIYAGDADYICNWLGNHKWTEKLEWEGKDHFNKVKRSALKLGGDGDKVGTVKSHGNFTFLTIHAAGHMVPYDQPEASLDFLNRWLGGEWM